MYLAHKNIINQLKYILMTNTSTLIDVVAMINARISMYQKADANDHFYQGIIDVLKSLSEELQMSIDADISALETQTPN